MAHIHYDRDVKKIMNSLSTSTNVLEKYDNVTYNITLYMYDYETEKAIDKNIADNYGLMTYTPSDDKKIIIAQSGVTLNFVIESLLIKSVNGTFNNPVNVQAYEMNLKIKEPMGANLTNALDLSALALGYSTHLERPYWIDIYFTGYEHGTMKPVKKIPLNIDGSGLDTLTYRGMFGDVKSSVDNLGTTWNMTFIPYAQKFTNKNVNYLRITSEFKVNRQANLKEILTRLIELMKKDYIQTFSEKDRKTVESYLSGKEFMHIKCKFNGNKRAEDIVIDPNTSNDDTLNNDTVFKIGKNEYFTTAIQKIMSKAIGNAKAYITSFIISPEMEVKGDLIINTYKILIEFYEDPIIRNAVFKNTDMNSARKEYITKSINNKSLYKKYIFGFSGVDTSVLEIHNVYDLLWYTTSVIDAKEDYTRKNINWSHSAQSKNNGSKDEAKINGSKDGNQQNQEYKQQIEEDEKNFKESLGEIKNYLLKKHYVEDMFYDKYEDFIKDKANYISLEIPERNNKYNPPDPNSSSSSEGKQYDEETEIADMMFDKLYKSGQLSTTKFTIIADPYWLIPFCDINENDIKLETSNVKSKEPGSRTYKCVFELRTFYKQVKNYRNEQAGFIDGKQTLGADYAMNTTLNISGIYIIYQVETKFEDGKFTQTLEGVLDPHFFNNF